VRADRLLSLVLLLQHRGRMSAAALARELEVSTRTVLRDIDALSTAGIPVYAERGRRGGFALLAGFSTDLTGLTSDEALALLVAGRGTAAGMAPALTSAMRKVVAALPPTQRDTATRSAERILVRPEGWYRRGTATLDEERLAAVRRAVFAGHRLRIRYTAKGQEPRWRTVDPVGLVSANDRWYLLATRDGAERTYLLTRMVEVQELDEPADRSSGVDLDQVWRSHRARFAASMGTAVVRVRVRPGRRADLVRVARSVTEHGEHDGWLHVDAEFADEGHAAGVLWSFAPEAEVLAPPSLRATLAARAAETAVGYKRLVKYTSATSKE
jgi:predicted DNA-binding transcriptional regulator YafY